MREYDAVIGRWTAVDPKGQFYSPYVGMGNNPVGGIDPDGGSVLDHVHYDSKTDSYRIVEADGQDQLFIDGKFVGFGGTDGSWRSYAPDAKVFSGYNFDFYNSFGASLRDDNLFVRLYGNAPSVDARGALFQASQANKDPTVLYTALGIPVAGIAAGELLGAAAAIELSGMLSTAYGEASLMYSEAGMLYLRAKGAVDIYLTTKSRAAAGYLAVVLKPLLYKSEKGRRVHKGLERASSKMKVDIEKTIKKVYKAYKSYDKLDN